MEIAMAEIPPQRADERDRVRTDQADAIPQKISFFRSYEQRRCPIPKAGVVVMPQIPRLPDTTCCDGSAVIASSVVPAVPANPQIAARPHR